MDNQTQQHIESSRLYPVRELETKNGPGLAVGPRPETGTSAGRHLRALIPMGTLLSATWVCPRTSLVSEYKAGY